MMPPAFIDENFLLRTQTAREIYHSVAANLPIIDYHCHLDPADLAADRHYENLTQLWLSGDPYKHRAMRIAGVAERGITGDASDREKFEQWAATVPQTVGNPLHHWTALELRTYFGIAEGLSPATAARIWHECNRRLEEPRFSARGLLVQAGVECVCTSDRLLDDLSPHAVILASDTKPRVLPSLRSDDIVAIDTAEFLPWLKDLEEATGVAVSDFESYRVALGSRLDDFSRAGCRLADHGFDDFYFEPAAESEIAHLFARRLAGETLTGREALQVRTALLRFLGTEYVRRGWVMQLHVGALRRTSSRLRGLAGAAGGYAGIGRACDVAALVAWFDDLEKRDALPRTILYPLNPGDFVPLAVLAGSFVEDGVAGKIQLGPAWWFNDHGAGMRAQFDAIANYGLLSVFVGMTTDSRSPLSMGRHDYFRRVFCDWLGEQAKYGAAPSNIAELGPLVRNVCCENARCFFAL